MNSFYCAKIIGMVSKEQNKCVKECKGDDSLRRKKIKKRKNKKIKKKKKDVYFHFYSLFLIRESNHLTVTSPVIYRDQDRCRYSYLFSVIFICYLLSVICSLISQCGTHEKTF